jgi:hypothetical protein
MPKDLILTIKVSYYVDARHVASRHSEGAWHVAYIQHLFVKIVLKNCLQFSFHL